jgi:hypothetical protein
MKELWSASLVVALSVACGPVQSRSLRITGAAGYLSEWELSGSATERISGGSSEFLGPLNWKHVGLCSVNGPQEKPRRDQVSDVPIGVPDQCDHLARGYSMHLQRRLFRQFEWGAWIAPTRTAFRFRFRSSDQPIEHSVRLPTPTTTSSVRIEPGVGQVQADHNSADD